MALAAPTIPGTDEQKGSDTTGSDEQQAAPRAAGPASGTEQLSQPDQNTQVAAAGDNDNESARARRYRKIIAQPYKLTIKDEVDQTFVETPGQGRFLKKRNASQPRPAVSPAGPAQGRETGPDQPNPNTQIPQGGEPEARRNLNASRLADQQAAGPSKPNAEQAGEEAQQPRSRLGRTAAAVGTARDSINPQNIKKMIAKSLELDATQAGIQAAAFAANQYWTKAWQYAHETLENFFGDAKIITGPLALILGLARLIGQIIPGSIGFGGVAIRLVPKLSLFESVYRTSKLAIILLIVAVEWYIVILIIAWISKTIQGPAGLIQSAG